MKHWQSVVTLGFVCIGLGLRCGALLVSEERGLRKSHLKDFWVEWMGEGRDGME